MQEARVKTTAKDQAVAKEYRNAKPKQFGTLHERMKFLIEVAGKAELCDSHPEVWTAIYDLQTEVECHKPAKPPFGRRTIMAAAMSGARPKKGQAHEE